MIKIIDIDTCFTELFKKKLKSHVSETQCMCSIAAVVVVLLLLIIIIYHAMCQ